MKIGKLRTFIESVQDELSVDLTEGALLEKLSTHLSKLIDVDDWLPEQFTVPHEKFYQQFLLYCDPKERFSVVSFVWGPGQETPIHNHTVWGLIGMLRGAELATNYSAPNGGGKLIAGDTERMEPGQIELVSPDIGDIHLVKNAFDDQTSISIHVYGANIGAVSRNVFDPETGQAKEFISGFSSDVMPNIWA